jgi:hypothetical protein
MLVVRAEAEGNEELGAVPANIKQLRLKYLNFSLKFVFTTKQNNKHKK